VTQVCSCHRHQLDAGGRRGCRLKAGRRATCAHQWKKSLQASGRGGIDNQSVWFSLVFVLVDSRFAWADLGCGQSFQQVFHPSQATNIPNESEQFVAAVKAAN
jgi:hypothetical protein